MVKSLQFDVNEVNILFKQNKTFDMRGLSNRLIREAAMENNYAKAELGVIAYSLHKIETKEHMVRSPKWHKIKAEISKNLEEALMAIKIDDKKDFFQQLKEVIVNINNIDAEMGHYAQGLYEKAKVKHASQAYSYGLSLAQAADLTGADKKELQAYVGFTKMHDEEPPAKNIKSRVKELKELLEG